MGEKKRIQLVEVGELISDIREFPQMALKQRPTRLGVQRSSDEGEFSVSNLSYAKDILKQRIPLFRNQIVLDLGAGSNLNGYLIATKNGARGYVGVERHHAEKLIERIRDASFDGGALPLTTVVSADMLDFLRAVPDNSVSVLTCGVGDDILFTGAYREKVREEIERVLHPDGSHTSNYSPGIEK
tara:strand:+ start:1075 stop:1629 length:555 start_codon:yes stop_codon:yes gene_type:complete